MDNKTLIHNALLACKLLECNKNSDELLSKILNVDKSLLYLWIEGFGVIDNKYIDKLNILNTLWKEHNEIIRIARNMLLW